MKSLFIILLITLSPYTFANQEYEFANTIREFFGLPLIIDKDTVSLNSEKSFRENSYVRVGSHHKVFIRPRHPSRRMSLGKCILLRRIHLSDGTYFYRYLRPCRKRKKG